MNTNIENILFIDIETVSQHRNYGEIPEPMKTMWKKRYEKDSYLNALSIEDSYSQKAAIYAEFGKIVCISVAIYNKADDEYRVKSFYAKDEKLILQSFAEFCNRLTKKYIFCGHNIKEFDVPYMCRRFLINYLPIPTMLNFQDKKPWEIEMLDTLQLWKFGDYKNYTSLETLTAIFNIPTPKEDIDGSQVGGVFWNEDDLDRIVQYCQNDVVALIHLIRSFQQLPLLDLSKIRIVHE